METKIRYAHAEHWCVLQLTGDIRHPVSSVVETIIDEFLQAGDASEVLIDLTDAAFIDSTNLGLIAKVARDSWQRGQEPPILVSTNPDINAVLESMGFSSAFHIVSEHQATDLELHDVPTPDDYSDPRKARRMLEAHEALIELDEKNRQTFQSVVDVLRRKNAPNGTQ